MGMYDTFYFESGSLPENKVPPEHDFQSKSLHCGLDKYFIKADKSVVVEPFGISDVDNEKVLSFCARVYSHVFLYDKPDDIINRKYLGCKYQSYEIVVEKNKMVSAKKTSEAGYDGPGTTTPRGASDE